MPPRIAGVIPARFASSRFPGKPLAMLQGRPLIVHVCERVRRSRRLSNFWVATDDQRIYMACLMAGYEARMTPPECPSGTDRIVASLKPDDAYDILVNIQGDEPRIEASVIDAVAGALVDNERCGVSTAAVPIRSREDFESPHCVKVVLNEQGEALYFSRSPLPSPARLAADAVSTPDFVWGLKHLGLYAYRTEVAQKFALWQPTALERRECLEQLRFLEHGVGIQVAVVDHDSIGIDTPEELEKLKLMELASSIS